MQKIVLGFYQEKAIELGLDLYDLTLLRWFTNFIKSEKMNSIVVDNKRFYWLSYGSVVKNCPILNIKKDAVYRRFKAMAEKNILERYTLKSGGTYSMYRIGEKYFGLDAVLENSLD